MKTIILIAVALVAVAAAAPTSEPSKIVRSSYEQQPEGGYETSFETENGIVQQETGVIKEVEDEDKKVHKVITVRGFYSYVNDQGESEVINYSADETGYHPEGKSIPKVPAVRR